MLEEEIELQGIDKCKMIERSIDGEKFTVRSPEMTVRIVYEEEKCIQEEIFNRSLPKLPKLYRVEKGIHKDEIKLEIPEINTIEISELTREIKLKMPLEQSKSRAVQDVNTSVHAEHDILLPSRTIDLCRPPPFEVSVASRKILCKIPKLHTRQKKVLGSKIVRRVNTTGLVKRKVSSIPLDGPNKLNVKASKRYTIQNACYARQSELQAPPNPLTY